jgi:hypothetical protein
MRRRATSPYFFQQEGNDTEVDLRRVGLEEDNLVCTNCFGSTHLADNCPNDRWVEWVMRGKPKIRRRKR